jgi:hypothetical protein
MAPVIIAASPMLPGWVCGTITISLIDAPPIRRAKRT